MMALTGCEGLGTKASPAAVKGPAVEGKARGGQQPVVGASIQLYAVGTSGTGSDATALLSAPVQTNASGGFSIPGGYTCPSADTPVYLVASGGNPGFSVAVRNAALNLMAAAGACGSIGNISPLAVNEVTTVASVWALAPFMRSMTAVGAAESDQARLADAFSIVPQLANLQTGLSPGPAAPQGATVPVSKVNTLGNLLTLCVNSMGDAAGDSKGCASLLTTAPSQGQSTAPTEIIAAALQIARHPTTNVAQLFDIAPPVAAFQPALSTPPVDWTLPITVPVNTPVISPAGGAFIGTQIVTMSSATPRAVVHYTLDGSTPSGLSTVYTGPVTLTASAVVRAVATLGTETSSALSAAFVRTSGPASKLEYSAQPTNSTPGAVLNPAVMVKIEDANGSLVNNATTPVTLSLLANGNAGALTGTVTVNAVNGLAVFDQVGVDGPGAGYQLQASSSGLGAVVSNSFAVNPPGSAAVFAPLPITGCNSAYDKFYGEEPGVIAFWPLCEGGVNPNLSDPVGEWNFIQGSSMFGGATLYGGKPGPVPDGETAVQVIESDQKAEFQGMSINKNAGTLATWTNNGGAYFPMYVEYVGAVNKASNVAIQTLTSVKGLCYLAELTNSAGQVFTATQCGYAINTWHRVAMTWGGGQLSLYVDGALKATSPYTGTLDDTVFYYQLFPGCCWTGAQTTLAKALIANQAWSAAQVAQDYAPVFLTAPTGGLLVSTQQLGTVHQGVLGYGDVNLDISNPGAVSAMNAGLAAAGMKTVRYAGGLGGTWADLVDWRHGSTQCDTNAPNGPVAATNLATGDILDNYMTRVAQPAGLDVIYTVNYGTNAPLCNAGGDPAVNAGSLASYIKAKGYPVHKYEIGNEEFAYGSAVDMHPNPYLQNMGEGMSTYPQYEPAFYDAIKAVDPAAVVAIPGAGPGAYNAEVNYWYPAMAQGKYDAIVFHPYPVHDFITDSSTLYPERSGSNTSSMRAALLPFQTMLLNFGKPADALWLTEWDGEAGGNMWSKQTLGAAEPLFAAMSLGQFMEAGIPYATWWAQGGVNVCSTYNMDYYGEAAYAWYECGSPFLVYTQPNALSGEMPVGFKPADLTPAARAFQILSQSGFVSEGEHMLRTRVDDANAPWLAAYAATHGGSYAVILINRDRDQAHTVPVQLGGKSAGSAVTQWTYGRAQYDQTYYHNWSVGPVQNTAGAWSGTYAATLPAWSINVLVFQ